MCTFAGSWLKITVVWCGEIQPLDGSLCGCDARCIFCESVKYASHREADDYVTATVRVSCVRKSVCESGCATYSCSSSSELGHVQ